MTFGFTAVVAGVFTVELPQSGLDPSWVTALNWYPRSAPGTSLAFTYGPLGWLTEPLALHRLTVFAAWLFAVVALWVLWRAIELEARSFGRLAALALASLFASLIYIATSASWSLLIGLALSTLQSLNNGGLKVSLAVLLTLFSPVLLLVKFSEGVMATAMLGVFLFARPTWRSLALCASGWVGWFAILWVAACNRSMLAVPDWLNASVQLATGYQNAMRYPGAASLVLKLAFVTAIIGIATIARQVIRHGHLAHRFWWCVCLVGVFAFACKEGFARADAGHAKFFLATALALLVLELRPHWGSAVQAVCIVAVATVVSCLALPSYHWPGSSLGQAFDLVANPVASAQAMEHQREALQASYQIPEEMLHLLGRRPVATDPWEVSAAWAYKMHWSPVPIFQPYAAYTEALDRLNTKALLSKPALAILREQGSIDGRLQIWDSPAYNLAMACHFRRIDQDDRWSLLVRVENRCGQASVVYRVKLDSGQPLLLPSREQSAIMTVSFAPRKMSIPQQVWNFMAGGSKILMVHVEGQWYRLPTALCGGPLIVGMPASSPLRSQFQRHSTREMRFNMPGTATVSVRSFH